MSWFNFLKFSQHQEVVAPAIEELSQEKNSIFIAFDKELLSVCGGEKRKVAEGHCEWSEDIFISQFAPVNDPVNTPASLTLGINDLKHRLEGGADVSAALSMESVFTKYITIPKNNLSEQLLQAEMKKYVPLPFNEMLFASNKVTETETQVSYFCIVIHKPLFDKYIALFKNYGIQPYFELGCFSLARLAPEGVSMLVYVGAGESYVLLVRDRVLIDLSVLSVSSVDIAQTLSKKYNLSLADATLLVNTYAQQKAASPDGSQEIVLEVVKEKYSDLAREIVVAHEMFAATHGLALEQIHCIGVNVSLLQQVVAEVTQLKLPLLPIFIAGMESHRYTHQIGLAKRA